MDRLEVFTVSLTRKKEVAVCFDKMIFTALGVDETEFEKKYKETGLDEAISKVLNLIFESKKNDEELQKEVDAKLEELTQKILASIIKNK